MARLQSVNRGFSLTEVLLAVGILSVGMIFIAGVFPVAIHLTTIATERTIAAAAADEAFAKVESCVVAPGPLAYNALTDFNDATSSIYGPNEFTYPSVPGNISQKQYFWSALCRKAEPDPSQLVQVTVFVFRRVSPNLKYYCPDPSGSGEVSWPTPNTANRPVPVKVEVSGVSGKDNELKIDNADDEKIFINGGYTIVDDETGRIYRVLERYKDPDDDTILLDRNWIGYEIDPDPDYVWVVPPPVNGGRGPCIAVYQKIVGF